MEELANQLGRFGLLLVFFNVLIEQAGLPVPSTPVLVLCGALAVRGEMSVPLVLLTAVSASLLADEVWFFLGRRRGRRTLKWLCRISLNPDACVRQTERLFERYGLPSVIVAKFIPGYSTVAPPLAGAMGVGTIAFAAATSLGALLWVGGSMAIGWVFHATIESVADWLESLGFWGFVVVALVLGGFIAYRLWKRSRFHRLLQMSRITPEELRSLMDSGGDPMVFDVRTDSARRDDPRRIPGALVLYMEDPEGLDARITSLPRDRDIILYCT